MTIDRSVPQGSILGPVLFNVYIDDIVKKVKNVNVTLFADDCCILYSDNNLNALMNVVNDDLGCTYEWTVANKLSLNLSKCHYMLFTRKKVFLQMIFQLISIMKVLKGFLQLIFWVLSRITSSLGEIMLIVWSTK